MWYSFRMPKNPRLIDLTGQRFGRWVALRKSGNTPGGGAIWSCRCDCGTQRDVIGQDLRNGKSSSCGCMKDELIGDRRRVHGETGTRIHRIWVNMRKRCLNPNATGYADYGGRGITFCEEWNDFIAFRDWSLENGYREDLTIERIDVDGDYEPSNCTWAGADVQSANRRFVRRAPDGELWWHKARANGITRPAFTWRISQGWPMELVVTHPLGQRRFERERDSSGKFI